MVQRHSSHNGNSAVQLQRLRKRVPEYANVAAEAANKIVAKNFREPFLAL
jgi:hypothetical protein